VVDLCENTQVNHGGNTWSFRLPQRTRDRCSSSKDCKSEDSNSYRQKEGGVSSHKPLDMWIATPQHVMKEKWIRLPAELLLDWEVLIATPRKRLEQLHIVVLAGLVGMGKSEAALMMVQICGLDFPTKHFDLINCHLAAS